MTPFRTTLALAVVCASLLLGGCDSLLDLEPKQSIPSEDALSTPENVEIALIGAYDAISDYDLYGGQLMMLPDLLGDSNELFWGGTFAEPRQVWNKSIQVNNTFIEDQWVDAYRAINIVNSVLSALDVVEDEDARRRIEGEAKFVRAAMHFELVRVFARAYNDGDPTQNPGVPVVTEPTTEVAPGDSSVFLSRDSVADVYAQVISDLEDAKALLPETNSFFADTYAASAMLSRVYLMQGNYGAAAAEASRVIESGHFELAREFAGAFNNSQDIPEYIFAIQISAQDNDNHSIGLFYDSEDSDPAGQGRGDIDILDAHMDLYEENDERADFFYFDSDELRRTSKWAASKSANIPVIRLAEMYLTRAEGNFRAGTTIGDTPLNDINTIRNRAGLSDLTAGELDLDAILRERKLELSFEGHTLHDVKRNELSVGDMEFDDPRLVYPIPQREVDANRNLTQNPGYGS